MSSAHVYVRLHRAQTIDNIPEGLLEDCAQLVKANSIQGKFYKCFISATYLIVESDTALQSLSIYVV